MRPGKKESARPARRADRARQIAEFSDLQWYMYRQRNVVFYAAFAGQPINADELATMAVGLMDRAPQLAGNISAGENPAKIDPATLARIVRIKTCAGFDGLPEAALGDGFEVFDDPDLPMFRITCLNREGGPDGKGRAACVLIRVSHALVEGADSARLTHSRTVRQHAAPTGDDTAAPAPWIRRAIGQALAHLAVPLHLLVAVLRPPDSRRFVFETLVLDRKTVGEVARSIGVSQRAVLFALVFAALFDLDGPKGKKRMTSLYSVLDRRPRLTRDSFIRMRMLQTGFGRANGLEALIRSVNATLVDAEKADSGLQQEISAASVALHRRLEKLLPGLYSEKIFSFIPFDMVVGLIPPHRLGGVLTERLLEPVYCGTTTPGLVSCVIVPNRRTFAFGLYIDAGRAGRLAAIASKLAKVAR